MKLQSKFGGVFMKKISFLLILILALSLWGCNKESGNSPDTETQNQTESQTTNDTTSSETETQEQSNTEQEQISGIIKPLDSTIDISNLTDGTFSVALEEDAFYVDENGTTQVIVTIYAYDFYAASDIETLKLGDTIQILNEDIVVSSLEKTPFGNIVVNGGFELGGYDFTTKDGSLYFIIGASDTKAYYEIGLATLPVASEFLFYDESDNTLEPFKVTDFLIDETPFYYSFSQYNTTIELKDGVVISMTRIYTP